MNRLVVDGLVREARAGRKVLAITANAPDARLGHLLADDVAVDPSGFCNANGRERFDWASGGSLRFVPYGRGVRGLTADLVFLDHAVATDPRAFAECRPCALPSGEVIRA